jgi:hypothetical protein
MLRRVAIPCEDHGDVPNVSRETSEKNDIAARFGTIGSEEVPVEQGLLATLSHRAR